MTETPSTPTDEQIDPAAGEPTGEASAEIMPIEAAEPPRPDADTPLESSGELEEPSAEILDAELARLLTTPAGVQAGIEALLFASPEPLAPRKIGRVLGIGDLKLIQTIIGQLQAQYDAEGRGMQIVETAGGYQMATREVYADLVLRLRGRKRRPALSPAALETLAIVAYRQPIIRAEIEAVRGVESSGMLRNLMDMGLVEIVGRKDVLGRPAMYGTSEAFLQSFGLKTLAELPPIAELKRRLAEQAEAAPEQETTETAAAPALPAPPEADSAPAEPDQAATETSAMKEPMDQDPIEDDEPFDDQDDDMIEDGEDDEAYDDEDDLDDEEELDDEEIDDLGDEDDLDEEDLEDDEDFDEDEDDDDDLDEDEDEDEDRPDR
ncbi:MAG: SMC-Scp complex subunit ScpB [Candidatus Sumerlaeia bacterium]